MNTLNLSLLDCEGNHCLIKQYDSYEEDYVIIAIHPSQIDEVILFLLAHKKQVEELGNKE